MFFKELNTMSLGDEMKEKEKKKQENTLIRHKDLERSIQEEISKELYKK